MDSHVYLKYSNISFETAWQYIKKKYFNAGNKHSITKVDTTKAVVIFTTSDKHFISRDVVLSTIVVVSLTNLVLDFTNQVV